MFILVSAQEIKHFSLAAILRGGLQKSDNQQPWNCLAHDVLYSVNMTMYQLEGEREHLVFVRLRLRRSKIEVEGGNFTPELAPSGTDPSC